MNAVGAAAFVVVVVVAAAAAVAVAAALLWLMLLQASGIGLRRSCRFVFAVAHSHARLPTPQFLLQAAEGET